jgi:hypothetical protein
MKWKSFLYKLNAGDVIPVIGNDLSLLKNEAGQTVSLNRYIVEKLIEIEEIPPGNKSIGEILLEFPGVKSTIKSIYEQIPGKKFYTRPLEKLAAITDFDFYVSTSFDDLLEKALRKTRNFSGSELNIINYSLQAKSPGKVDSKVNIFNLLGSRYDFDLTAIDEETMLEYFFNISWRDNELHPQAEYFLREVNDKSFLFIGCDFPDWLMRFVVRILTNRRIKERAFSDYIVCDTDKDFGKLKNFLAYCEKDFVVIENGESSNPEAFVDLLYEKWREKIKQLKDTPSKGSVFLSYYNKDREDAGILKKALESENIDVWFDKDDLQAGEVDDLIWKAIDKCGIFIPIISGQCLDADESESYAKGSEWKWAGKIYEYKRNSNQKFVILPCSVGEVDRKDERIPGFMRASTIFDLKGNLDRIIKEIKRLLEFES